MWSIKTFSTNICIYTPAILSKDWSTSNKAIVILTPSSKFGSCSGRTIILYRKVSILETYDAITTSKFIRHSSSNFSAIKPQRRARGQVAHVKVAAVDGNCCTRFSCKSVSSHRGMFLIVNHGTKRRRRVFSNRNHLSIAIQVVENSLSVSHSITGLPVPIGICQYRGIICSALRSCRYSKENKQK